jgi:CRP-like cAMP-binding protein
MSPGESYQWFYYVQTGMIHIQRPTNSGKETIISLAPGKSFGELALIADKLAAVCPYCIVAGAEGATVATISSSFLFQVGESHPELGRRLSLLLARKLAKSLTMKEQPMKKLSRRAPSVLQFRQEAPEEVRRTEKLVERFDLDKTEVYIRECPAVLISKQKFHGTLGLTRNFVLFFAQVFGFKKKKIIPIRSIQELVYNDEKFEVSIASSTSKKPISFRIDQTHFSEMKPLLASLHQVTVGSQTSPSVAHLSPGDRAFRSASTHQLHMSREDWNLLLQGDSTLVRYNAGDTVVKMGQEYACMYQLASGSCRIEQEERKGSKVVSIDVLGWLKPGEIFGEISFLIGGSATASVIAEEETSIYVLDTVFLSILFHSDPLLAARLYFYLSEQIGQRLLRNSDSRDKSPARMSRSDRGSTTDS